MARFNRKMNIAVRWIAIVVGGFAAFVFSGWLLGIPEFTTILPQWSATKATTSILLLCSAGALGSMSVRGKKTNIVYLLLVVIAFVALGTLIEYGMDIDLLHIDEIIFPDEWDVDGAPGLMSFISAAAFLLFAIGALAPERGRVGRAVFVISNTIGLISVYLSLLGYLYDAQILYSPLPSSSIAPPAAVCLVVLFVGLAILRPNEGWVGVITKRNRSGAFARRMIPLLAGIIPALGWLRLQGQLGGFYGLREGLALFTTINVVVMAGILWISAKYAEGLELKRIRAARSLGESERRLRDAEIRHDRIAALLRESVCIVEGDKIIAANPFALRMLGVKSGEELIGRGIGENVHPDDFARFSALITEACRAVEAVPGIEVRMIRDDGTVLMAYVQAAHLTRRGESKILIVARDVTLERESERRLRESQKLSSIGHLTGGIAHNFNNLLTVILSNAEAIRDKVPSARAQADVISQSVEEGTLLVRRLLMFARKQHLEPTQIDVSACIDTFRPIMRVALAKRTSIKIEISEGLPLISADVAGLESALLNLILNARDAMPNGGSVTISANVVNVVAGSDLDTSDERPGDYVAITVADTGSGMPPEVIEHLFEPFFTTKAVDEGIGLGLSGIYGFMKESGGNVRIASTVGIGTTVSLLFPVSHLIAAPADTARTTQMAGLPMPAPSKMRILVVDDNELLRDTLQDQLEQLGYEVTTSARAADAALVLEQDCAFDGIVSDVVMPGGMNGAELAKIVGDRWPKIGVLLMSGYTSIAGSGAGSVAAQLPPTSNFLAKPYTRDQLTHALTQAIANARQG